MLANGLDLRPEKTGWFYTSWWFFHQTPLKNIVKMGIIPKYWWKWEIFELPPPSSIYSWNFDFCIRKRQATLCVCVCVCVVERATFHVGLLLAGLFCRKLHRFRFFWIGEPILLCGICFLEAVELLWDCSGQAGPYNSETCFRAFWGDSPTFHHISGWPIKICPDYCLGDVFHRFRLMVCQCGSPERFPWKTPCGWMLRPGSSGIKGDQISGLFHPKIPTPFISRLVIIMIYWS